MFFFLNDVIILQSVSMVLNDGKTTYVCEMTISLHNLEIPYKGSNVSLM